MNPPFIDSRAYNVANKAYVPFPSQADAMLASLQLFHDVPCRIMDLVFSVVTHPDFDSKQMTLRNSIDVIDVVEEHRLKDRMAVVNRRTLNTDGYVYQAGFPQFVLDEVLDIIHAERMESLKAQFHERLGCEALYYKSMSLDEDNTLKKISIVHRSWTLPAQKALGRIFYIGRPTHDMNVLLSPVRKSIFGPWTSVVALQLYHPIDKISYSGPCSSCADMDTSYDYAENEYENVEYGKWLANLRLILVGFTNLKIVMIKSYSSNFYEWLAAMFGELVQRNMQLEDVTLHTLAVDRLLLDPLIENATTSDSIKTLDVLNAHLMPTREAKTLAGFSGLSDVTIRFEYSSTSSDLALLSFLSNQLNPSLKSLSIIDVVGIQLYIGDITRDFTPSQCTALFQHLRKLTIDSRVPQSAGKWMRWIIPYCSSLRAFNIATHVELEPEVLYIVPVNIQELDLDLSTQAQCLSSDIIAWMKCLLEVSSSRRFPVLKSLIVTLSKDIFIDLEKNNYPVALVQTFCRRLQDLEEEMRNTCKCAGVKCNLDIL